MDEYEFGSRASSLCVPRGWEVTVYKDEGYCSTGFNIKGPSEIADLKILTTDINSWNNSINSVKVVSPDPVPSPFGELAVNWAGVIDNSEGTGFPHGPHGNLHILIYDAGTVCPGNRKNYPPPLRHIVLPGPHPTGNKCEWDDGDLRDFDSLGLFEWRSKNDSVIVFIYESDGISHGKDSKHDGMFCSRVGRKETLKPKFYESSKPAKEETIKRSKSRNADEWAEILPGVVKSGVGKMFIELQTVPFAVTYNLKKN